MSPKKIFNTETLVSAIKEVAAVIAENGGTEIKARVIEKSECEVLAHIIIAPYQFKSEKKITKVYRDKNRDVFCSSCGFPLHRQRSEGNYCSGCGAALDWN